MFGLSSLRTPGMVPPLGHGAEGGHTLILDVQTDRTRHKESVTQCMALYLTINRAGGREGAIKMARGAVGGPHAEEGEDD